MADFSEIGKRINDVSDVLTGLPLSIAPASQRGHVPQDGGLTHRIVGDLKTIIDDFKAEARKEQAALTLARDQMSDQLRSQIEAEFRDRMAEAAQAANTANLLELASVEDSHREEIRNLRERFQKRTAENKRVIDALSKKRDELVTKLNNATAKISTKAADTEELKHQLSIHQLAHTTAVDTLNKAHSDTIMSLGKSMEDDLRAKYQVKEKELDKRVAERMREINATHDAIRTAESQKLDELLGTVGALAKSTEGFSTAGSNLGNEVSRLSTALLQAGRWVATELSRSTSANEVLGDEMAAALGSLATSEDLEDHIKTLGGLVDRAQIDLLNGINASRDGIKTAMATTLAPLATLTDLNTNAETLKGLITDTQTNLLKSINASRNGIKADLTSTLASLTTSANAGTNAEDPVLALEEFERASQEEWETMLASSSAMSAPNTQASRGKRPAGDSEDSSRIHKRLRRSRLVEAASFAELVERTAEQLRTIPSNVECVDGINGRRPLLGDVFYVLAYIAKAPRSFGYLNTFFGEGTANKWHCLNTLLRHGDAAAYLEQDKCTECSEICLAVRLLETGDGDGIETLQCTFLDPEAE